MGDSRFATLPSVLALYAPDLETDLNCSKLSRSSDKKKENCVTHSVAKTKKSEKQHSSKSPQQNCSPYRSHTPGESRHSAKLRKEERERQVRVADTWDQARAEVLQERHEILNQKLVLQHALIKAQDARAEELRRLAEDEKIKKRDDERLAKQVREAALQDQCKQSMAKDKKAKSKPAAQIQSAAETPSRDSKGSPPSWGESDAGGGDGGGGNRRERMRKTPGHGGYLPSHDYSPALAAAQLRESDDEEAADEHQLARERGREKIDDGVVTPADLSSVPWHHAQLYKMYGRHADYYIHPKMQPEQKKVVHPTLKSQKGHMGAGHIWHALRTDSKAKLYRKDRRFPQELKDAFSSHVRDGINNKKEPVFRNFTVTEDVPDLKQLMDQSLLRHIRVLRHKTELMYRSSQTNNDRTKVLLFNSPLPAVNEGDEGIGKYLPPWEDDASDVSDASYMKWIDEEKRQRFKQKKKKKKKTKAQVPLSDQEQSTDLEEDTDDEVAPLHAPTYKVKHPVSVLSPVNSETSETLQGIWHRVMARQKPRRQPKYHFLTEEEARTQGAFLEKLGLDKERIDAGRVDLLPIRNNNVSRKSMPSSLKSLSAIDPRSRQNSFAGRESRSVSAQFSDPRFQSHWQPLTMRALVEYKEQMATEGRGDYQQGRPRMWKTSTTVE